MKRIFVFFLTAVFLLTFLSGCNTGVKTAITEISKDVLNGSSTFALDIFKALNNEDEKENIFISPISISTALTMTYNGAEKSTKTAMENALGFSGIDRSVVNEGYQSLISHLQNIDKKVTLNIGNSIWIKEGETIKKEFINTNKNNFKALVETLDFSKASSVDTINNWISDATKGKIEKMLEAPIDPDVVMYLINAIYFKGAWTDPFDPKNTTDAQFHAYDGSNPTVKMMSRNDTVEYGKGEDYKAVRLPYGKGKTSMNIILPNEGTDINEYIKNMDEEKWNNIRESIDKVDEVVLKLPKFKLEYGIKNLNDSLKALGMEEAFSDQANFSGIREGIKISRVLHKAVIEVNEEGSTAAAATVVEMRETAALLEPITFIADRPFIFFITDDTTGTLLFMGKVLSI